MRTIWRGVLGSIALISVTAGCSDKQSYRGDDSNAAESGSTLELVEAAMEAPVSFDQAAAVADGMVSEDEMGSALDAAVECLAALGVESSVDLLDPEAGLPGGWAIDAGNSAAAVEAVATCRAATIGELEMPFDFGAREESSARIGRVAACLEETGLSEGEVSLEVSMNDPESDAFKCLVDG